MTEPAEPEREGPSIALAGLGAALPLLFLIGAGGLFAMATMTSSHASLLETFREMGGMAALVILATSGGGAIGAGACLFFLGRGARLPIAIPMSLAVTPWLAGVLFMAVGLERVWAALAYADAAQRAALMAAGIAEATQAPLFGATLASGLCAAVAVGLGLGAVGQRAPRRSAKGALIGGALTLPLLGLAFWALVVVRTPGLIASVAALGALLAATLGGFGIGADEPRGRSAALGAAAPIAAGLAVLLAVGAARSAALVDIFAALAFADPSMRGVLLARGVAELAPLRLLSSATIPVAVTAAGALAGWSLTRIKPSSGRIAGGVALVLVVGVTVGSEALVSWSARDRIEEITRAPWADAEGFTPVELPDRASYPTAFSLTTEGLARPDGGAVSSFEAGALARAIASAIEPEALDPDALVSFDFERAPRLGIALDARVSAPGLRAFFDALAASRVEAIELQGEASGGVPLEAREEVDRAFPGLGAALAGRGGMTVIVGAAVPVDVARRDAVLRHVTLGATAPETIEVREGAELGDRRLGGDPISWLAERTPLWIAIGDEATGASLAATCAAAHASRLVPVIVTGAIPGLEGLRTGLDPGMAGERPVRGRVNVGVLEGESGTGLFDPSIAVRTLRTRMRAIQACYERALQEEPTLRGRVVASFTIQPTGLVTDATVTENDGGEALAACVTSTLSMLRFVPGPEDGSVTYTFPFVFEPQ